MYIVSIITLFLIIWMAYVTTQINRHGWGGHWDDDLD